MRKDAYTHELAATVDQMFADDHTDPSAEEIAVEHFGRDVLGGEIIDGVIKRLKAILRILDEIYDHQVCLISNRYYLKTAKRPSYREQPPKTEAEARICLPLGHAVRGIGIWLSKGDDDLIYQAAIRQGFASGGAKVRIGLDRTLEGMREGRIPEERAVQLIEDAERSATPVGITELEKIRKRAETEKPALPEK